MVVPDIRQISIVTTIQQTFSTPNLGWFDLMVSGAGECL